MKPKEILKQTILVVDSRSLSSILDQFCREFQFIKEELK